MEIWYPISAISVRSFSNKHFSNYENCEKADFWYIDQLSGILNGSSVKMILAYNIMKILSSKMSTF